MIGGNNSNILEKFQYDDSFNLQNVDSNVNKGIVKSMLLKSTKPEHFLFKILHQLLWTGNNSQNKLYHKADEVFETWTQKMIALLDKVTKAKGEKSQSERTKQTDTASIDKKIQVLNHELSCITATQYLLRNPIYLQAMIHAFDVQCDPR